MTPEQLELISHSAEQATAEPRAFAARFYGHLFEIAPDVRPLFPDDMTEQGEKLVDELVFLTNAATDLDSFVERARDLGRRHDTYGAEAGHYGFVREALLQGLRTTLGEDWTDAHAEAWSTLYNLIAETMLDGANQRLFAR